MFRSKSAWITVKIKFSNFFFISSLTVRQFTPVNFSLPNFQVFFRFKMFRQSALKIKTVVSRNGLVRNCCKDAKKPPLCAHHKELVPPFCEVVKLKNFELKSDCTTFHMKSTGGSPPCPPAPCPPAPCPPTKAETSPCDPCNS